ncbi:hypothetical protein BV22DRAFT_980787, partial [Leucogyrophana mollusca]
LGKLPLVIGMPVMITHNFDVDAGIVNGCVGTLSAIRYMVDADGFRHATSCVVDTPGISGEALPALEVGESAAVEGSQEITI